MFPNNNADGVQSFLPSFPFFPFTYVYCYYLKYVEGKPAFKRKAGVSKERKGKRKRAARNRASN